jgi:hypothetical protein
MILGVRYDAWNLSTSTRIWTFTLFVTLNVDVDGLLQRADLGKRVDVRVLGREIFLAICTRLLLYRNLAASRMYAARVIADIRVLSDIVHSPHFGSSLSLLIEDVIEPRTT